MEWSDVTKFDLQQNISDRFWFFFLHQTAPNWCPERCAKFHVDTVINEEVINPRPAGPLDFPPPAGGGGVWTPPHLSRLLCIVDQNGKRRSKAREKSFRNHFVHFLAQVKNEVTRGQNSKIFRNGFWTIKSLILKAEQRFWYHRVCLVKARRTMYNLTLKGQGQNLTSGQVRARSLGDPRRSNYTSFDAPCGDKRNDSNPTSLSHLVLKVLAKHCWWPRVTSMTFRGVTD